MSATPAIRGTGLTKIFGRMTALEGADITVMPGEVRALVGSNGAGKSTLIKILTGAIAPTSGSVEVNGLLAPQGDPAAMLKMGVACIYQHSNLAPAMSVLDNIYLGRQPSRFGFVAKKAQRQAAQALLDRHGIDIDLDAPVASLATVKQKEVEILKALALDARVIIMDEPTGWLSAPEVAKLHETIRALKARGVAVIYISHMLDEIFAICDQITIMRDGKVVAEGATSEMNRAGVVKRMVGERLAAESIGQGQAARHPRGTGKVRLGVRDLSSAGLFQDVSFDLYQGEILCITGLIGSRRSELLRAIFGADTFDSGRLELDGVQRRFHTPAQAMAAGIGFVPEDRHRDGLMLGLPLSENLAMTTLKRLTRGAIFSRRALDKAAAQTISDLSIHPKDPDRLAQAFSGGNQQKALIGKWLVRRPDVLVLDEPTVGVDVGAKAEIYAILRAERDRGAAVLVVSSDLEEVATLADRIGVMVKGRLVAIHDAQGVPMDQIVAEIGGEAR